MKDSNMESDTTNKPEVGTLDIVIKDPKNLPIADLEFQIIIDKQSVASGKTDASGNGKTIEGLKIGSIFEIHVKTDKGGFKKVAIGQINSSECVACLQSPKTRFEFSSYVDYGKPGNAAAHKDDVIANSGHTTATKTNTVVKHTLKNDRDAKGKPVILVVSGAKIYPAAASKIIAALPFVEGKSYEQGVFDANINPSTADIPSTLVCNEYVFFVYGRAGEKLPYSRAKQIEYFKHEKRYRTGSDNGEIGDVAFFDGHEAIVTEVKKYNGSKWYRYSGTHTHSGSGTWFRAYPVDTFTYYM